MNLDSLDDAVGNSVDPVIKAQVVNLVSSLGGPDLTVEGRPYKLGADALACLRDLTKLLRSDELRDRSDVARCIADTNLVTNDLLEILTEWELLSESKKNGAGKHFDRIALACLELLVPLTWPIELNRDTSTEHQFASAPHLAKARLQYKRAVLMHSQNRILKAVLRLGLPSLRIPLFKRSPREEGILKLIVFFLRNILAIDVQSAALAGYAASSTDKSEDDVSRSTTIKVLKEQNALKFLLMLGSEMGREFVEQDGSLLECLFHLLKGIKPENLYGVFNSKTSLHNPTNFLDGINPEGAEQEAEAGDEEQSLKLGSLADYLNVEKRMKNRLNKKAPSRHNRFGTLVSVEFPPDQKINLSGSTGISNFKNSFDKLDQAKKWKRPRQFRPNDPWDKLVVLTKSASKFLKDFVEQFLDAAFNPFVLQIRKMIDDNSNRFLKPHGMYFLYVVAWFLGEYRCRLRYCKGTLSDFGLIGAALSQKTFSLYGRLLVENVDIPAKLDDTGICSSTTHTGLLCFKEILAIISEMEKTGDIEDQDIAENIKKRLFYEEYVLNAFVELGRRAHKKSISFMRACIELIYVLLKMLEKYAHQHTSLWVKSRRNQKSKKGMAKGEETAADFDGDLSEGEEESAEAESKRVTTERKWNFTRYQARFINESTVELYNSFLTYHEELTEEEVCMCISFIARCCVKCNAQAIFFRADFLRTLQQLLLRQKELPHTSKARRNTEKFAVYFMRILQETLERSPSLIVEMLFPKQPNDIYYYNHGYDKPTKESGASKQSAFEWEFKEDDLTPERRLAILVAALIDNDQGYHVEWLMENLSNCYDARKDKFFAKSDMGRAGNDSDIQEFLGNTDGLENVQLPVSDQSPAKNSLVKKLLQECGLSMDQKLNIIVPAQLSSKQLEFDIKILKRYMFEPVEFDNGGTAADQLRRSVADDVAGDIYEDSEDERFIDDADVEEDEDGLHDSRFSALPEDERMARLMILQQDKKRRGNKLEKKNAKKKRSADDDDSEEEDDTNGEARKRRKKAAQAEAEKIKQLKSTAFVNDSDDESDEERDTAFFEREKRLREEFKLHEMQMLAKTRPTSTQTSSQSASQPAIITPEASSETAGYSDDEMATKVMGSVLQKNAGASDEDDEEPIKVRAVRRAVVLDDDDDE